MLNEPQDVFAPIAQVHDVPNVMDRNLVGELGLEPVADPLQSFAEGSVGRAVSPSRIWIVLLTSGRPPAM
jgi:hypothetical protein